MGIQPEGVVGSCANMKQYLHAIYVLLVSVAMLVGLCGMLALIFCLPNKTGF